MQKCRLLWSLLTNLDWECLIPQGDSSPLHTNQGEREKGKRETEKIEEKGKKENESYEWGRKEEDENNIKGEEGGSLK